MVAAVEEGIALNSLCIYSWMQNHTQVFVNICLKRRCCFKTKLHTSEIKVNWKWCFHGSPLSGSGYCRCQLSRRLRSYIAPAVLWGVRGLLIISTKVAQDPLPLLMQDRWCWPKVSRSNPSYSGKWEICAINLEPSVSSVGADPSIYIYIYIDLYPDYQNSCLCHKHSLSQTLMNQYLSIVKSDS